MIRVPMRGAAAAVMAAAAVLGGGAAAAQEPAAEAAGHLSDGLACAPFRWVAYEGRERAAIMTDVVIDGHVLEVQLDTGADLTMIYGQSAEALLQPPAEVNVHRAQAWSAGGAEAAPKLVFINRNMREGGTLGLDYLVGKVTVIDYPAERLCILDEPSVPDRVWLGADFVNAELRNGKLFVPMSVGETRLDELVFDTGSSLFPLVVDLEPWTGFTGLADTVAAPVSLEVPAWGVMQRFAGAPTAAPLRVGERSFGAPTVYTLIGKPREYADDWPFSVDGVVGNAPFWDKAVVLDLTARMRFGVGR